MSVVSFFSFTVFLLTKDPNFLSVVRSNDFYRDFGRTPSPSGKKTKPCSLVKWDTFDELSVQCFCGVRRGQSLRIRAIVQVDERSPARTIALAPILCAREFTTLKADSNQSIEKCLSRMATLSFAIW